MTTEHQTMRQRVAMINCHPAQLEGEQRAALEERIRRRLTPTSVCLTSPTTSPSRWTPMTSRLRC